MPVTRTNRVLLSTRGHQGATTVLWWRSFWQEGLQELPEPLADRLLPHPRNTEPHFVIK